MEKYRYNSLDARYAKVNRVFLLGGDLLFAVMFIYLWLYSKEVAIRQAIVVGVTVCLLAFAAINTLIYLRNKSSAAIRVLIIAEVALEFAYFSLTTPADFLGMALVGVLGISLAYYDKKFYRLVTAFCFALYIGCQLIRNANGLVSADANGACRTIITCAIFIMLSRISSITKMFSDDSLSAIEEQRRQQETMMGEILEISQIVKHESDRSKEMVERLVASSQQTALNIQEISQTTDATAGNIETQTKMTMEIQNAITQTQAQSREMVAIASDSDEHVKKNREIMDALKAQSAQIRQTNSQVMESMEKLQQKTKEVEQSAGVILGISDQTDLLAVNASIESARAGAAGKGFAVVAKEIRQLAEESRKATQSISEILKELQQNSQEVVRTINTSVEATENQNEMILTSAAAFGQLGKNMAQLISNIGVIDKKIEDLSDSNRAMVDSISQISASTQEITANAEETNALTKENLGYAKNTRKAINSIQNTASRLEQYI